jgi:hypothetical protein
MGFLAGLLPTILKTVGKVTGLSILGDAGDALDKAQLTPEQKVALNAALAEHEEKMAQIGLDQFKTAMSESLAEIQSSDKFVARARPTGLYAYYLVCLAIVGAMLAGLKIDATAILTIVGPLAGTGGFYIYNRTQEKLAGNGKTG